MDQQQNWMELVHLLQIFPKEVWYEIFGYLKEDPRDIINLSDTCNLFLEIVGTEENLSALRLEEVLPLVLKWLPFDNMLNCRGIRKRIKNTVDKVLDHVQILTPHESPNLFPRLNPPSSTKYPYSFEWKHFSSLTLDAGNGVYVSSVEEIERLTREIEENKVSKLVFKSISISSLIMPPPAAFFSRVFSLLEFLHQQIVNFNFIHLENPGEDSTTVEVYDITRKCIEALPNLKCLELNTEGEGLYDNDRLEEYIANGNPLPPSGIETISLSGYPSAFIEELFRQNHSQLKKVVIDLIHNVAYGNPWDEEYDFPLLYSLELHDITWGWEHIFQKMRADHLTELRWEFDWTYHPKYPVSTAALFFRAILHFPSVSSVWLRGETDLDLSSDLWDVLHEVQDQRQENVEKLVLDDAWYYIPLYYFAGVFPNLEEICLKCDESRFSEDAWDDRDPDIVLCSRREMVESDLWRQLPKLQTFRWVPTVGEVYCCTREEADTYHARCDLVLEL